MRFICFLWLLLLLGGSLVCTLKLDELEMDAQVAPPPPVAANPKLNLWRSFMGQVRQALHRFQPTRSRTTTTSTTSTTTTTTKRPPVQFRGTTKEPELQFYGALNPIFQMRHF
ncbi:hypothetical protein ACLKA6_009529 [Drosophila palustris]